MPVATYHGSLSLLHLHEALGFLVMGAWFVFFIYGLVLLIRKREAGRVYYRALRVLEIGLGLEMLAGIPLFFLGGRPTILHYGYGGLFPIIILVIAHNLTRGLIKPPYHVFFTIAAFLVFGLSVRAVMTGLGLP